MKFGSTQLRVDSFENTERGSHGTSKHISFESTDINQGPPIVNTDDRFSSSFALK